MESDSTIFAERLRQKELRKLRRTSFLPAKWSLGLRPQRQEYSAQLGGQIARAGGAYPVVVVGSWCLSNLMLDFYGRLWTLDFSTPARLIGQAFSTVLASPLLFLVGYLWAGLIGLFCLPLIAATSRLVGWPSYRDAYGKVAGSVVAFVATLPAGLGVFNNSDWEIDTAVIVGCHVALAIAMGQIAGCLAGTFDLRRRNRGRIAAQPLRFSTWQLLAFSIPASLLLSLLHWAELLSAPMAASTVVALLSAAATWKPAGWLANSWLDRRLRRRRAARFT